MVREAIEVIIGDFKWKLLKLRYSLNYSRVVLVLTGENEEVDHCALNYLDNYVDRKVAKEAVVVVPDEKDREEILGKYHFKHKTKVIICNSKKIERIYKRNCLSKLSKNLVFTYVDKTQNNLLGRFMRETDINAEDVVCLALYNFRLCPDEIGKL